MSRLPEPYEFWDRHCEQQERELAKYPRCSICDNRITDDYVVVINGELICEECLQELRKPIEDFME